MQSSKFFRNEFWSLRDTEFKNFRDEFWGFMDRVGVVINGPCLSPDLPERVWLKFKKCPFVLVLFSMALSFEVASLKQWQSVYNYLLSP